MAIKRWLLCDSFNSVYHVQSARFVKPLDPSSLIWPKYLLMICWSWVDAADPVGMKVSVNCKAVCVDICSSRHSLVTGLEQGDDSGLSMPHLPATTGLRPTAPPYSRVRSSSLSSDASMLSTQLWHRHCVIITVPELCETNTVGHFIFSWDQTQIYFTLAQFHWFTDLLIDLACSFIDKFFWYKAVINYTTKYDFVND